MATNEENLLEAFAGESQAYQRYMAFARMADEDGYPEIADLFRASALGEAAHAMGHLKYLGVVKNTPENLREAIDGENYETKEMYPRMARDARESGNIELAEWFEKVSIAEERHAKEFKRLLDTLI